MAPARTETYELGLPGASLRGVAGDGASTFAALATGAKTSILTTGAVHWAANLDGVAGPMALGGGLLAIPFAVTGPDVHGEPGARVDALDPKSGSIRWRLGVDATEWVVIAAIAAAPDGIAFAGTYQGTLRIADQVVASAGRSDGFVARVSRDGKLAWLVRIGGDGADAITGVALAEDRVAVAGNVASGADVLGQALPAIDTMSLYADAFVAVLDGAGHRVWAKSFGSPGDDHVAGVAIDARGRVVVAATARDTWHVDDTQLDARGKGDALVAWFAPDGGPGPAMLLGGPDFDGVRAIVAVDERVVIGGFFSGAMHLGTKQLVAGGGDDAFLAALDGGAVVETWPVTGPGREEVVGLAAIPGGFVAGIAHTAQTEIGTGLLPAPKDPTSGAGVIVRGLR